MIIVIEGPTAAGKSTRITAHRWLDPARVHWDFPATGTAGLDGLGPRAPRSGTDVFDALMARLPAR